MPRLYDPFASQLQRDRHRMIGTDAVVSTSGVILQ